LASAHSGLDCGSRDHSRWRSRLGALARICDLAWLRHAEPALAMQQGDKRILGGADFIASTSISAACSSRGRPVCIWAIVMSVVAPQPNGPPRCPRLLRSRAARRGSAPAVVGAALSLCVYCTCSMRCLPSASMRTTAIRHSRAARSKASSTPARRACSASGRGAGAGSSSDSRRRRRV
jgi:hypothetical protein